MVGAAVVAFIVMVVLQPGGVAVTRDLDDMAQTVAPLLVAVPACWIAATRCGGRLRRFWALLALFAGSWGLGQIVWSYLEITRGHAPTGGSAAVVGFLLAPVFGLAAVVVYPGPELHWAAGVRAAVDGLLIVSTLLFVSWTIAGDTGALGRTGTSIGERVTVLTYPATDIVLLAVLATVAARSLRSWRDPLVAVGASFLALFLGDSLSVYAGLSGTYSTGHVIDVFWVAAFLLLAVGAVKAGPTVGAAPTEPTAPMWTEFITYLPLGLALAMAGVQIARGTPFDKVELVLAVASFLLLVARSFLFVTENRALMMRFEGTVRELQWLTLHDPLTGLANRVLYADRLEQALAKRARSGRPLAVAYLDLDDFKAVNDTFGHDAGDELLHQVARRLSSGLRDGDTLARLSGDEFAMLLTDAADTDRIERLLRRLRYRVDEPFEVYGTSVHASASIGFTVCDGEEDAETLLRQADEAMYAAKHRGKDRVCRYDATMARGEGAAGTTRLRDRSPSEGMAGVAPPWFLPRQGLL